MSTLSQTARSPHVLMWIAGIAAILFSAAGIAAIMGWIPIARAHVTDNAEIGQPGKVSIDAPAPAAARTPTPTPLYMTSDAPVRATCTGCGVIESAREIPGNGGSAGAAGGAIQANR